MGKDALNRLLTLISQMEDACLTASRSAAEALAIIRSEIPQALRDGNNTHQVSNPARCSSRCPK